MLKRVIIWVSVLAVIGVGQAFAENDGAKIIELEGNEYGNAHLSHVLHQIKLKDCEICHKLYAKETGAIEKSIKAGTLKRMQVMNYCNECHKETALAGKRSGPTACKGCHWY